MWWPKKNGELGGSGAELHPNVFKAVGDYREDWSPQGLRRRDRLGLWLWHQAPGKCLRLAFRIIPVFLSSQNRLGF